MIDIHEVIEIHRNLIKEFSGSDGVRDYNGLKSALDRPFSGFGDTEFYPSLEEKASAVLESIIKNHPFVDGNKRIGYVIMRLILLDYKLDIDATQDEKYNFVIDIASSTIGFHEIKDWIKKRLFQI